MNRALLIILVPACLVALGYVTVFRLMGMPVGYGRLAAAAALFGCGIWWLSRRGKK